MENCEYRKKPELSNTIRNFLRHVYEKVTLFTIKIEYLKILFLLWCKTCPEPG